MEFMKCSIGGELYGLGITEVGKNVLLRAGQEIPPIPDVPLGSPITKNVNVRCVGCCLLFVVFC